MIDRQAAERLLLAIFGNGEPIEDIPDYRANRLDDWAEDYDAQGRPVRPIFRDSDDEITREELGLEEE